MNASAVLMNQKMNSALKTALSLGLYGLGIGAGAVGGLVIMLLAA